MMSLLNELSGIHVPCVECANLKDTNATLSRHLASVLNENELLKKRIEELEAKTSRSRTQVPKDCQSDLRKMYKALSQSPDFLGFYTIADGSGLTHPINVTVKEKLLTEMRAVHGDKYSVNDITEAIKVYYKSRKSDSTRRVKGTLDKHRHLCKRSKIIKKKCERRRKALSAVSWDQKTREYVSKTLSADYISSEEDEPNPPEMYKDSTCVKRVKTLPWRSQWITARHIDLDIFYWGKFASPQEKRCRTPVLRDSEHGEFSSRPAPDHAPSDDSSWIVSREDQPFDFT